MARRRSKYSRRVAPGVRNSEKVVIISVAIAFVMLCVIISVIVGVLLGQKAEENAPQKRFDLPSIEYTSGDKTVKSVDAYAYEPGVAVSGYINRGIDDLSFCVRDSEGNTLYDSAIDRLSAPEEEPAGFDLASCVERIHESDGFACAYFYLSFPTVEDESLCKLYKAYELALISEISRAGVDDILLLGLDINESNIDEIEYFVYEATEAASTSALGVAVSEQTLHLAEQEIYLAGRIKSVCDYIALDLRDMSPDADKIVEDESAEGADASESLLEATLDSVYYYLKAYEMRIILSKDNAKLYDSARELGIVNIQIVGK